MHNHNTMKRIFTLISGLSASGMVLAHEGHGIGTESHWHATDSWGLLVGVALVLAVWWGRKP